MVGMFWVWGFLFLLFCLWEVFVLLEFVCGVGSLISVVGFVWCGM